MSVIFMEIGRSSPRHQELALLYARSKSLQSFINEYFIVAVEFCHQMLLFTQRSAFHQFTTALSSNLIKKTQSDMDDWGGRIKDEMLLLIAKRTEDEARENSRFRSISKQFSKSASQDAKLAMKLRILQECSTYDHETAWKQIRKCGNTTTFTETDDYKQWKEQSRSCTLLYYGKLGCGKSVVLSNMVDDINLGADQHDTSMAYFFARQDLPESLKGRTVIGSLVRQLLVSLDDFTDATSTDTRFFDVQDMVSLLLSVYNKKHRVYLVLDGLDLCKKEEIEVIVGFVKDLQEEMWVLTCVSLRQEPHREPDAVYRKFQALQISSLPDNNSDITSFIDTELAKCVEDGNLKLGNATLILTIRHALLEGSNGMFLWVALQIKVLCSMATDREIEEALEDLPTDLSETYSRILQKVQGRRKFHQAKILRLISAARVPLSISEMRDALSVTPGRTDWTNRDTINDIYSTLTTCGCLIQVDEEESTVRFVHPSVQEFFLQPRRQFHADGSQKALRDDAVVTMEDCHQTMADIIVTYLSYGVFDTRVSTSRVPVIEVGATPSMAIRSVTEGSQKVQSLALKLLAHRKRLDFDIGKTLAEDIAVRNSRKRHEFPFLKYAQKWCFNHVLAIKSEAPGTFVKELFPAILDQLGHTVISESESVTALMMAIEHNNKWLLELLAAMPNFSSDHLFQHQCHGEPIIYNLVSYALCNGNERAVKILGRTALPRTYGGDPICHVIEIGDTVMVGEVLREHSEQSLHICQSGRNPVAFSIWRDKPYMARDLLLQHRIDPNTGSPGHTPVEEAIARKSIVALDILLQSRKIRLRPDQKDNFVSQAKANWSEEAVGMIKQFAEVSV
jgi:hypothetical protein